MQLNAFVFQRKGELPAQVVGRGVTRREHCAVRLALRAMGVAYGIGSGQPGHTQGIAQNQGGIAGRRK